MYCLLTISALFLGFAAYQIFWGARDLRLAARLRRGEAVPIGEATVGRSRVVLGEVLPAEGIRGLIDARRRAWIRGRFACVTPDNHSAHGRRVEVVLEHEPAPLRVRDASGIVEVVPRRAHDALPDVEAYELDPSRLPAALAQAAREKELDLSPSRLEMTSSQLFYEENAFDEGERLYVFGRVTRAAGPADGGAYRGEGTPARIEDAVVSPSTPAALAVPFRNRGLMLLLGGLIIGGLGAAMLSAALRIG